MGAVKIKAADRYFSRCVRERADWRCERCGAQHQPGSQGLHCSHFHGRGKWGLRFHPDNAFSLCYGCHSYVGSHPSEHTLFVEQKIGRGRVDMLQEMANDISLGRVAKRSEAEIRKHYRAELSRMQEARAAGDFLRIEFENWC